MDFIDLATQYREIKTAVDARIQSVLDHGQYINGPEVLELEKALCTYTKSPHCISCANGTDALQLALMAYGIGPGDAVFTTSFSFFATAEAICILGARPVFVDIDPNSYNICPMSLELAISDYHLEETPKAIIAVDLFGLPADYIAIKKIANKYNLLIIEDAAQGLGGKIGEQYSGTFGDISTTSFFPAKPLGCYGDGGALFTSNDDVAKKLRSLKNHGQGSHKYENIHIGMNSRLDTIQAAILLEKLKIFEQEIKRRNCIAQRYNELLEGYVDIPLIPKGYRSSWAQYTITTNNKENFKLQLEKQGIPTESYYPLPLHKQQALKRYQISNINLAHVGRLCAQVISLPMHPYLSEDLVIEITSSVKTAINCLK